MSYLLLLGYMVFLVIIVNNLIFLLLIDGYFRIVLSVFLVILFVFCGYSLEYLLVFEIED